MDPNHQSARISLNNDDFPLINPHNIYRKPFSILYKISLT